MTKSAGFTLVEMVIVIVISGILAAVVFRNVARPIEGFVVTERRAELVDSAETALSRMTREMRLALPNSIRIQGNAIELLRTLNGGRYRAQLDTGIGTSDVLDFALAADSFDVLGPLQNFGAIAGGGGSQQDCIDGISDCLVIFNTGNINANAYNGDNMGAIVAASATSISFTRTPAAAFPLQSPNQRFHIVDTPVSFVCDLASGEIRRYADYSIAPGQTVPPVGGGAGTLVANRVTGCTFSFDPGTATRSGLVTIAITLAQGSAVERLDNQVGVIRLLQQVHVPNLP